MRAGKYSYQELFVNRYVEQLIIPEIQRDYVWEEDQVKGLITSIINDFEKYQEVVVPNIDSIDSISDQVQLNSDFAEFYKKRNHSTNIGFIYAYSDPQYEGRYFLIDGQQRITTIFLTLLLLASRVNNASEFNKFYCVNGHPKLDYRLRESSSSFLEKFIPFILDNSLDDLENQNWYLKSYEHDVTITNIIKNVEFIQSWLNDISLNEKEFYDYLNHFTEFWYFDTNISAQGENLYIYLNARGEQMQGNENLKAELLSRISDASLKNDRGLEWESWQDFFWKMRQKGYSNPNTKGLNADKGFNEFLGCITGLKICLDEKSENWVDKQKAVKASSVMMTKNLDLEIIANYVKALKYIENNKSKLADEYSYYGWVENFLHEFWGILNTSQTNWIADYSYDRLATERRRMVFVWGVIHWVSSALQTDREYSITQVFRGIRQYYLRYKNNIRAVVGNNGIKATVNNLIQTGFISTDNKSEEYQKEHWLARINQVDGSNKIESTLWELEDHPYNLDGSDVGLTNSSHLIEYTENLTLEKLTAVKNTFYICFPAPRAKDKANFPVIQSLLLHYGDFWHKKSPHYYENYQFNDWRNIIRSRSLPGESEFNQFFEELVESCWTAEKLLEEKRKLYVVEKGYYLREQLLWYSHYLQERMWAQGGFIARCHFYTPYDVDKIFGLEMPFYNTRKNFVGHSYRELASLLPDEID